MKIKAYNERENIRKELDVSSIEEAANLLKVNLDEVIIIKNNELVTANSKLKVNDEIKFLSVISGG